MLFYDMGHIICYAPYKRGLIIIYYSVTHYMNQNKDLFEPPKITILSVPTAFNAET